MNMNMNMNMNMIITLQGQSWWLQEDSLKINKDLVQNYFYELKFPLLRHLENLFYMQNQAMKTTCFCASCIIFILSIEWKLMNKCANEWKSQMH